MMPADVQAFSCNGCIHTISFLLGVVTSVVSGFLGMKIATYANARTTLEARKGVGKAFIVVFRSEAVMGFLLAANDVLVLYIAINLFKLYHGDDWEALFESITGYGLGRSSMVFFGRVGGGIYTKAADIGADLVGEVERNVTEDDPRNPVLLKPRQREKMLVFLIVSGLQLQKPRGAHLSSSIFQLLKEKQLESGFSLIKLEGI
ncbi:pyrophosphate-energized vacuolar membrane proton pump-like [Daucus carota subsp. sativus]|uniref:pyrophosphate-energized vacuolar membrane proton pump-like n=1 Tax=Daucus carota subsp. sativus TaxID=79200 RepID=UPI0030836AB8